jgi:integrase
MRWGKVLRNVSDSVEPPRATTSQRAEMATWSATQLRTFLGHVRGDRLEAAWVLAATTGMRRGEVIGLRWSDLNLDRRELVVRQTVVSIGNRPHLSTPKTAKSARVIDLDPTTAGLMRAHRARQAEERLAWGPAYADTGLVFCRENGEVLTPAHVTRRFKVLSRQAGLPRIRLHDLRHTYATLSLQAGVRAEVVSRRLGHSRIAMTLDTYTHAVPALQREEAERVAALIFGSEVAVDGAR